MGTSVKDLLICVVAAGILSGCPSQPPFEERMFDDDSVVIQNFSFFVESEGIRQMVNGLLVRPTESIYRSQPVVVAIPGFIDNYDSFLYIANQMAKEGYIVISFDPADSANILPSGDVGRLLKINWLQLTNDLLALRETLEQIDYEIDGRVGSWLYADALRGKVDDEEALAAAQALFNYRLAAAEELVRMVIDGSQVLPGSQLADPDKIWVMSHSLGALTALQLLGAGDQTILPVGTVKGALMMAPAAGFLSPIDLAKVDGPTLWILGEEDDKSCVQESFVIRWPFVPQPKEVMELKSDHIKFSYTFHLLQGHPAKDACTEVQAQVAALAIQFFS